MTRPRLIILGTVIFPEINSALQLPLPSAAILRVVPDAIDTVCAKLPNILKLTFLGVSKSSAGLAGTSSGKPGSTGLSEAKPSINCWRKIAGSLLSQVPAIFG